MPIPMVECPEHSWCRAVQKSECSQCIEEGKGEDYPGRISAAVSLLYKWSCETDDREELKGDTLNFLTTEEKRRSENGQN